MSGGRVELGIGTGWFDDEHTAYGIPFPPIGERFDRCWRSSSRSSPGCGRRPAGETFSLRRQRTTTVVDSPALPKPAQRPVRRSSSAAAAPKRTPRLAARFADEFNMPFSSVAGHRSRVRTGARRLRDARPRPGVGHATRPPRSCAAAPTRPRSPAGPRAIGRDVDELRAQRRSPARPTEVVDAIGRLRDVGADRVYLQVLDLADLDHLRLIAAEVMPHV